MLTPERKLECLIELKKQNFIYNFFGFEMGLCHLYYNCFEIKDSEEDLHLINAVPELQQFRTTDPFYGYWWSFRGLFMPWFERHIALRKTISLIKKQIHDSRTIQFKV